MNENNANHPYVRLARETVRRHLAGKPLPVSGTEVDSDDSLWDIKRACFVSIKSVEGELRGCIGTIIPIHPSLDREIIANAISASTRDPRFPPMSLKEMGDVRISVDVLSKPERIWNPDELDPKKWGVIVSRDMQRGVLLPDLEGVDTVRQQLQIAAQKAGLLDYEGATIERFTVARYQEA